MQKGDKIVFTHKSLRNDQSISPIVKTATYMRAVKAKPYLNVWGNNRHVIQIDGNKNQSVVHGTQIKKQ